MYVRSVNLRVNASVKIPRPYQLGAVNKTWELLCSNKLSRPIISIPVGGGKSYVMALLIQKFALFKPDVRVLCLSHVSELAEQAAEELDELMPDLRYGFYSAKLNQKCNKSQVTYATIQSIYKKANQFFGGFDVVLIDEAHLLSNKQKSMYQRFLGELILKNPKTRIIGLTGTPFRSMKYTLIEEPDALFTHISYQVPMLELIKRGSLCEIVTPDAGVRTRLSAEGVRKSGDDYAQKQLQEAVDKEELTTGCVSEILEFGETRNKGIVFTAGVEHAWHVYDEFIKQGENSVAVVTGKTTIEERRKIIADFKDGSLKYLINVAVLTTGFNNPAIDLIAIMRPMRSPVLYTQVLGRAMRTHPSKSDSLLLDFGQVVETLGPIDTLDARIGKKRKPGDNEDAPVKVCPQCDTVNFAGVRNCIACDHEFPMQESKVKIEADASDAAVLSTQKKVREFTVVDMKIRSYIAQGKDVPVLKVAYYVDGYSKTIHEFICFEHSAIWLKSAARKWHKDRLPNHKTPSSVLEASVLPYPKPKKIRAVKKGQYYNVVGVDF